MCRANEGGLDAEDRMVTVASDEIDILAKAKRAVGAD